MIRVLSARPRLTAGDRWRARRHWQPRLVPLAVLDVEGFGRVLIVWERLETRWSDNRRRRLWRRPPAAADRQETVR